MKIISKVLLVLAALIAITSCATTKEEPRRAGELPANWWKISDTKGSGALENLYRDDSEGVESKVKLFVGVSDEPTNATESDAVTDAKRKAAVEISQYLALQVTAVSQSAKFNDYLKQVIVDTAESDDEQVRVVNDIKNQTNDFAATISITQFSSTKVVGKHAELVEDGSKYKAWVVLSITDAILEQTRKLQEAAFQNILDMNPEYKQLMADINTELTKQIKENVAAKTEF